MIFAILKIQHREYWLSTKPRYRLNNKDLQARHLAAGAGSAFLTTITFNALWIVFASDATGAHPPASSGEETPESKPMDGVDIETWKVSEWPELLRGAREGWLKNKSVYLQAAVLI